MYLFIRVDFLLSFCLLYKFFLGLFWGMDYVVMDE